MPFLSAFVLLCKNYFSSGHMLIWSKIRTLGTVYCPAWINLAKSAKLFTSILLFVVFFSNLNSVPIDLVQEKRLDNLRMIIFMAGHFYLQCQTIKKYPRVFDFGTGTLSLTLLNQTDSWLRTEIIILLCLVKK